jgi:hypothetical protein
MVTCHVTKRTALETNLYLVERGAQSFTMTLRRLRAAFETGQLERATRIWTLGWYDWVPLHRVLGRAEVSRPRKRAKPPTPPSRRRRALLTGQRWLELRRPDARAPGASHDAYLNKTNPTAPAWWLDAADARAREHVRTRSIASTVLSLWAALCVAALVLRVALRG